MRYVLSHLTDEEIEIHRGLETCPKSSHMVNSCACNGIYIDSRAIYFNCHVIIILVFHDVTSSEDITYLSNVLWLEIWVISTVSIL